MGAETKIQWAHHTFNPWIGCTKVDAACKNCYAEALMDKRWGKVQWGPSGTRTRTSKANWSQVKTWDRQAKVDCERRRVFCASLADVFEDRDELKPWRQDLLELIEQCRALDWMLLTKRPENVSRAIAGATGRIPDGWFADCKHVWIGASAGDQGAYDRVLVHLEQLASSIRFLSLEPLLGPINLRLHEPRRIDLVIVGGESGPQARPCSMEWIRSIVSQCKAAGVPCFVKQLGADPYYDRYGPDHEGTAPRFHHPALKDKKGGTPEEWPADLRVREMPGAVSIPA